MKILLVGGGGLLGSNLTRYFASVNCKITHYRQDINDSNSIKDLVLPEGFDLVINCSGLVGVEKCQNNPQLAILLNSELPSKLAQESLRLRSRFIHFSTPSVYSGLTAPNAETDEPDSNSVYGRTKASGDAHALEINPDTLVLRVNFVALDNLKSTLASLILANAKLEESFEAFEDVYFNPVEVDLLGNIVLSLNSSETSGLVNVGTDITISKYEFARKLYSAVGANPDYVKRVRGSRVAQDENFSSNTSLINVKLKSILPALNLSEIDYSRFVNSLYR